MLFLNRKSAAVLLAGCVIMGALPVYAAENTATQAIAGTVASVNADAAVSGTVTYEEYLKQSQNYSTDGHTIRLEAQTADVENGNILTEYEGSDSPVLYMDDSSKASFHFSVERDSIYRICIRYASFTDNRAALEQTMLIDGTKPFSEAGYIVYDRAFSENRTGQKDLSGNDVVTSGQEIHPWNLLNVFDSSYYIQNPFSFLLTAGSHEITFTGVSGQLVIDYIELVAPQQPASYAEYAGNYSDTAKSGERVELEAENYSEKSAATIIPSTDRSSASTSPQDAQHLLLNVVGGTRWSTPGQSISWTVDVPKDGLYRIALRYKQSEVDGIFVSRQLKIDGKVPFGEMQAVRFPYGKKWNNIVLGDDKGDYWFYLSAGSHQLSMQVVLGDVGELIGQISDSLVVLNTLYRKILMITGPSPDKYRDYNFSETIPDVIKEFGAQYEQFVKIRDQIEEFTGSNSSYISIINTLIYELHLLNTNPVKIATHLDLYKSNLGSLGTWLLTATSQPLLLDKITLTGEAEDFQANESGWIHNLGFNTKCFLNSFIQDYEHIGQTSTLETDRSITVWLPSGRDQAQIVRRLIDNSFAQQENIQVNLQLVAASNLLPSVLAQIGPDISMSNAMSTPVDYAVRNAVVDLSAMPDFNEVAARFYPESLVPFTFENGIYALPETMTFPMFFYRKDIFSELGLQVPQTWNDFLALIPVLQSQNMNLAIPTGLNGFMMILSKNGGELYHNHGEETALGDEKALSSFQEFTELFTMYQLPVTYDFANRFRTGELPCGIQSYDMFNKLSVFAPEIKGLWDFIPVPAAYDETGNQRSISIVDATGIMVMKGTKDVDACWKFVKWWLDDTTQSSFGIEMESILGTSAKYASANRSALENMNWTRQQVDHLQTQIDHITAVEQVPGGYYSSRVITFAFNASYSDLSDPVENLQDYLPEMNEELTRKREEFHLHTDKRGG